jgi:hypothetical protein
MVWLPIGEIGGKGKQYAKVYRIVSMLTGFWPGSIAAGAAEGGVHARVVIACRGSLDWDHLDPAVHADEFGRFGVLAEVFEVKVMVSLRRQDLWLET